jgi:galactonate dehydratase
VKIVDVETYAVGAEWKNWLFVRVLTDEGLHGVGEATLNGLTRTCETAVHELKHLVVGADPREVRRVGAALLQRISNDGGHVHRSAIAGIEVACWDILGKSLGVPIHQLFGGLVRESIECYANGWYRTERTPEAFAAAAGAAAGKGFRALKFDPLGTAHGFFAPGELELTRDIITAVGDAVGPRVKLLVDLHARLAEAEAVALIDACADLGVFWWEEPTTRELEEPTSSVAKRARGRIATGETFDTVGQFLTLAQLGGVSIFQPEPMSLGGIVNTVSVAGIAGAAGAFVAPHQSGGPVATAVCLQLAGFLPNFLIQEHFDPFNAPWTSSLVTWTPAIEPANGHLPIPVAPGLGVDLVTEVANEHRYDQGAFLDVTESGWEQRIGHGTGQVRAAPATQAQPATGTGPGAVAATAPS